MKGATTLIRIRYLRAVLFLFMVAFSLVAAASVSAASSIVYQTRHVYGVTAHVVTVNLNDPRIRVTVNLSKGGIGTSETMQSFVSRLRPEAAITGTFFDTSTLHPVGDIVMDGRRVHAGPAGTGFAVLPDNTVDFKIRSYGRSLDWSDYRTVLCTGPTLLSRGRNALYPIAEGYRDSNLFALKPRTAVGVTRHNKLLLVAVNKPIYLRDMRSIMKHLGATDAVGLDGGSSSALFANGRHIVRPSRRLTNLLSVYRVSTPSPDVANRLAAKKIRLAAREATKRVVRSLAYVNRAKMNAAPQPVPAPVLLEPLAANNPPWRFRSALDEALKLASAVPEP